MYHSQYRLIPQPIQLLNQPDRWRKQANIKGLSGKARLRLEWIIFHVTVAQKKGSQTTHHFGIKKSTFYYWYARFNETNLSSLEDELPVPRSVRTWLPDPLMLRRMIQLRKCYPTWGKMKLSLVYQSMYGEKISSWQFQRTMQHFHLVRGKKRTKLKNNGVKKQRISLTVRNKATNLFSLDTIVIYDFGCKRYILTALAHTTKIAYARVYTSHSSHAASNFLQRLSYLVEENISVILTDNGSEFAKHFDQTCTNKGIARYYTKPHTPKDNPEVERFNRTIQEEWLNEGNWHSNVQTMNESLTTWLMLYNNVRPHQALHYKTPLAYAEESGLWSKRLSSSTLD